MSNYLMRKERQRLRRRIKEVIRKCDKDIEYERAACERQVHEAKVELGRARYEHVVRWNAPMRVAFEREPQGHVPTIKLQLYAKRMQYDVRMLRDSLWYARQIERDVAHDITQALLNAGLVSMDACEVPSRDPFTKQYDFGIYFGKPIPKKPD